jgi:hypothetical protein
LLDLWMVTEENGLQNLKAMADGSEKLLFEKVIG